MFLCFSTGVFINNERRFNGVLKLIASLGTYVYLKKENVGTLRSRGRVVFKKLPCPQIFKICPAVMEPEKQLSRSVTCI